MTVYVFGDSFCARTTRGSWVYHLKQHYDVTHFGKPGTGPYYSFDIFYELLLNNEFKDGDKIVFGISTAQRTEFTERYAFENGNKEYGNIDFFKKIHTDVLFRNFKDICFLHQLAKNTSNIDFFVFRTLADLEGEFFSMNDKEVEEVFDFVVKYLDIIPKYKSFLNFDTENFYYLPESLLSISVREIRNCQGVDSTYHIIDKWRHNHLSEENNLIFFNKIKNFFERVDETLDFEKDIYYNELKKNDRFRDFIYE